MSRFQFLEATEIMEIHAAIIEPHELQGLAMHKSLESTITRITNRLHYGTIEDIFHLAACYGVAIAVGHAFHDANKRTAFQAMWSCLAINGIIDMTFDTEETVTQMVAVAQGSVDEIALAAWLREKVVV